MNYRKKTLFTIPVPATKRGAIGCKTESCASLLEVTAPILRQNNNDNSSLKKNQKGEKKMPQIFVNFRPAEVVHKKETYVSFYVLNPLSGKLERKRIRCNHVHGAAERLKYARLLCSEINQKLYEGWNPFLDQISSAAGTTLDAACSKFLLEKRKSVRPDTLRVYDSIVEIFRRWLQQHKYEHKQCFLFSSKAAEKYMSEIADNPKIGNRTYNNHLRCLKTLFKFMQDRDFISENPFERLHTKRCDQKVRVIIPKEDRALIKDYYKKNNPDFYVICQLCYRLFMRPKEILMLKIGMYDPKENILTIPAEVSKNHNIRMIALPEEIRDFFSKKTQYPSNWYVFSDPDSFSPGKTLLNTKRIGKVWKEMRDKLKLPASYQFYSLKDTGITEMLEAGVPAKYVKELADHHSLEMTEKYTHRSDAKKILEWNRLEF